MKNNAIIFALTANVEMAKEISKELGIPLGQSEVVHFADGEIIVENATTVRGKNVYIIQSTCNPVTERLMELLVFIDGLKRASAKEICVVMPYYGYARQDRKAKPREPITSRLVADMLKVAGADRIIVTDLHAPQIQGFFTCPVDDLSAVPLFADFFRSELKGKDIVVVSPDHGGVTRARKLASFLNDAPIAIIDKRRPRPNVAQVMNIIGDVKGKVAIMIDDIVDTAGTLCIGAQAIKDAGATEVYAAVSHGVLSGPAIDRIKGSCLTNLVITDSIPLTPEKETEKIKVLTIAPMIAKVIEYIEKGISLSIVHDMYHKNNK